MAERGSATLLLPVGLLLMITLGAIAVDLSHLHTARADLQARADAAANDAVTAGMDPDVLRSGRGYRLDRARAGAAAARAAGVEPLGGLDALQVETSILGPDSVAVEVEASVDLVFAPALPGGPERVSLRATATARAEIR
jgi:hypothetical protein